MTPDPFFLMAIKGSASAPSVYGSGSRDHLAIVSAIDDAISLVSTNEALSWDGPDHPSRSWILEMSGWVEVGVFEYASTLQFSFDVVAPADTDLSRSVLSIRDERLGQGWFSARTPGEARLILLNLLKEWRTICADGEVVDHDKGRAHAIPERMRRAGDAVISRFSALAVAHDMAGTLDADGVELMWHMRSPSAYTAATLCGSASGNEEATFDDRTMKFVLEGLPEATWARREASDPMALTIAPYEWNVGSLIDQDPVSLLRQLSAMGMDWDPEMIVKDERG